MNEFLPVDDRILVRPIKVEHRKIAGTDIVAVHNDAANDTCLQGEVLAVGPGLPPGHANYRTAPCSVGDIILVPNFGGTKILPWHTTDVEELRIYGFMEIIGVKSAVKVAEIEASKDEVVKCPFPPICPNCGNVLGILPSLAMADVYGCPDCHKKWIATDMLHMKGVRFGTDNLKEMK